jgi:hypothetical protein
MVWNVGLEERSTSVVGRDIGGLNGEVDEERC